MAFVLSGIENLQFTTPINLGTGRLNDQLQQLRSSHQWVSYSRVLKQVQRAKIQPQLFEWCIPSVDKATVLRSNSIDTEIAISAYNALADECVVVSHMIANGQWDNLTGAFVNVTRAVDEFNGVCDDVFSPRGRAALCRPVGVGPRTVAGVLPMVFSVEWTTILMAAITDLRQCVACQRAVGAGATEKAVVALEKGALATVGLLHAALVVATNHQREGDASWEQLCKWLGEAYNEHELRATEITLHDYQHANVEPVLVSHTT